MFSGMCDKMLMTNYDYIDSKDTIKFVCGSQNDLIKAKEIIDKYNLTNKCAVYISPIFGAIKLESIVEFMINNNMNGVNMQLQMHKYIWDPNKKGV